MATRNERVDSDVATRFREFVDKNRLFTYFVVIELSLIVTAYWLDTWTSFTLGESGPDMTDVTAGLLGGWAVVFGVFGLVGFGLMAASRFWIRIDRR
ncbi:hypothetical protein [Haloprofundus halobius]|uniref:hypothetical protein n=1 Tax=Haloprofundus halobius TaxID=2876194 RepID=UPI001CCD68C3|nr:hypothetical protein [Haloprofundus halobius]